MVLMTLCRRLSLLAATIAILLGHHHTSAQCAASFNLSQAGGVVTLSSTSVPQNSTTAISWTVPGASPVFTTGLVPNVTYTANGVYTVMIQNNTAFPACNTSLTQTIIVNSVPCNPVPWFSVTHGAGGQVFFNNLSIASTSYTWNFGDGNSSTASSPTNTYPANGTYVASLTALGGTCSATATLLVHVNSYTCSAGFIYTVTPSGNATFSSTSVPQATNNNHQWNFGNGSTMTVAGTPTAQHTYTSAGQFLVILDVQTAQNCTDTTAQFVTPCLLMASFAATQGSFGQVTFSNTSSYSAGTPSFTWNFGEGNTSQVTHPTHQYTSNGTYTVTLNGSHGLCLSDTSMVITVSTIPGCSVQASFTHTLGEGGLVKFESTSTGMDATHLPFWRFGDGHSGVGKKETHQYTNGGTHYAMLVVSSTLFPGCADSTLQAINITGIGCHATAQFSIVPAGTGAWQIVPLYPWNVSTATWSWGDGTTSSKMHGSHTYNSPGTYTICLTLTNSCGASASYCATHTIPAGTVGPLQVFVINPVSSSAGETIPGDDEFLVFPNPACDKIHLKTAATHRLSRIVATDLSGRIVLETVIPAHGENPFSVDISGLPDGYYILRGLSSGHEWRCPLVIRK